MNSNTKNEKGFTLLEILIAVVLLSVGMLAMGSFLGSFVNRNAANERMTTGTAMAEEKVEALRSQALSTDLTAADGSTETLTASGGNYTRTWVINDTNNPHTITVTVAWVDGETPRQVVLATLVNDNA